MSSPNEDKKDIELEEREKKLNEENKAHDKITEAEEPTIDVAKEKEAEATGVTNKIKSDNIKEIKPKKIPTGGILMPGFFTRSKSKEKCKETDEEAQDNTELLAEKESQPSRIKLPNLFRRSKSSQEEGTESTAANPATKILETLRKPLNTVKTSLPPLPRWLTKKEGPEQSLENQTKAGLASMETLDDNDKTADASKGDEMKNIPLDDKDVEKQQPEAPEEPSWKEKIKAYRIAISATLAFVVFFIIILAIVVPGDNRVYEVPIKDGKYVETVTSCGFVEGILDDGAVAFRGVPYARPPVGPLRFKPAQPLDDISYCWNGTMLAHNATDTCLQIHANGSLSGSEDCLTLDVVTPYVRYDTPLPVIVLIGADSLNGGSPGKMRPSARYARSRDVLFVRPNFRLGALGFLSLGILNEDVYPHTSGNYGLTDIVQALRWIQLNIEHFGGDPRQVTLFGHKAGATLVTALATTPGAQKLFARAWATSGSALFPSKLLSESEKENESYLAVVNCKDVSCLRNANAESLMQAVEDTWRKPQPDLPAKDEDAKKKHEWMVIDGKLLKEHPATVWASEKGLPVKLVLGSTAHSAASEKLLMKQTNWTEDLVSHHVRTSILGGNMSLAEEALTMYAKTYKGLSHMISDIRTVCPLLAISTQMHNATFYVVTQERGVQNISDVDSDVDAILGRYEPKTPEQRRYFSAIQQLFYHFVWLGKIQTESSQGNKVLVVGQDVLPAQNYSRCDFWINKNVVLKYAQLD